MKQNRNWLLWAGGLCLVLSLVLSACGNPEQSGQQLDEEPPKEQTPLIMETPEPEEIIYPYYAPLTGIGTEEELTERPITVMVENSPAARPQSGLHKADLVYEILAEGDITRFIATYQSETADIIGPVRSIRPYFVELGDALDAVIVHAGWSQEAMNMLAERGLNHLDAVYGDHPYYWRSTDRSAPHNLYTSIEKIKEGAEDKGFRKEWNAVSGTFAEEDDVLDGEDVSTVTMDYLNGYQVGYEYHEEDELFYRMMAGEEHLDRESGQQITAANVLICRASHTIVDDEGRRHVDVFGPGEGYLLQKGKIKEITWENIGGFIRAFDESGQELPLVPGKTWIQVIPLNSDVTYESSSFDQLQSSELQ